jgi:hypothetical protein
MIARLGDVIYWAACSIVAFYVVATGGVILVKGIGPGGWANYAGDAAVLFGLWLFAISIRYALSGKGWKP